MIKWITYPRFLTLWPDWIPVRWRPGTSASTKAWGVVFLLCLYISADTFGLLEVCRGCIPQRCGSPVLLGRELAPDHLLSETTAVASSPASPRAASRALSSAGSAGSGSSDGDHSKGHQHDALLFLFNAFVLGTITTHLMTWKIFEKLQQTVVLFVLGILYSVATQGLNLSESLGPMGHSYIMWMDIDPHLILFSMLPALLTGDAMCLDTTVARRVAKQCVYLATIGVCLNGFLSAAFLYWYLPYDWSFLLSLTTGSILCATDPVAVVTLLKEIGASPTLTVLIQGESLLNDGTAIVLYTVSYAMLKGAQYDVADIVMFLVKQCMCAWGLGMIIGAGFLGWIWLARNRFEHHNGVIQVSLTLCCAYWSFIMAEGVFHISGVLATVASALMLAHAMWPHVVDKEAMHNVWHMLEYLGNTIIFFLAGALFGRVMVRIPPSDYLHLLVIYVVITIIRFVMLLCSKPILKCLSEDSQEVTVAEVIVMTWGGLRGAVGLTLAIQVTVDRADGMVTADDADRVLFFVGGIAALTLVINAVTCPNIVEYLGLTQLGPTKRRLLLLLRRRMKEICMDRIHQQHDAKDVRKILKPMMQDMDKKVKDETKLVQRDAERHDSQRSNTSRTSRTSIRLKKLLSGRSSLELGDVPSPEENKLVLDELRAAKILFDRTPKSKIAGLSKQIGVGDGEYPPSMFKNDEVRLNEIMKHPVDFELQRAVNDAFLCIIRSMYWHDLEHGNIKAGTIEADVLMGSIESAMNASENIWQWNLGDWDHVHACVTLATNEPENLDRAPTTHSLCRQGSLRGRKSFRASQERFSYALNRVSSQSTSSTFDSRIAKDLELHRRPAYKLVNSSAFHVVIFSAIIINATLIFVEEEYRNAANDDHLFWSISDIIFNVIFTVEFLCKLPAYRCEYFTSSWNLFDLFLVITGLFGMLLNQVTSNDAASSNTGVLRIARVFRVLRLVRMARLVKLLHVFTNKYLIDQVSAEFREHYQKVSILTIFAKAHMRAQPKLFDYFGTSTEVATVEVARCIVQSEISVYHALFQCVEEEQSLNPRMLDEVRQVRTTQLIAGELENFIMEAHQSGVLDAGEAKSIVIPLREYMEKKCMKMIRTYSVGEDGKPKPSQTVVARASIFVKRLWGARARTGWDSEDGNQKRVSFFSAASGATRRSDASSSQAATRLSDASVPQSAVSFECSSRLSESSSLQSAESSQSAESCAQGSASSTSDALKHQTEESARDMLHLQSLNAPDFEGGT